MGPQHKPICRAKQRQECSACHIRFDLCPDSTAFPCQRDCHRLFCRRCVFTSAAVYLSISTASLDPHSALCEACYTSSTATSSSSCSFGFPLYRGSWSETGEPDGQGSIVYADGAIYTGDIFKGQHGGQGRLCRPNGEVYEGQWADNQKQGFGRLVNPDGDWFEGYFKDDLKHGSGREWYGQGLGGHYTGGWVRDQRHGIGQQVWPAGQVSLREYRHGHLVEAVHISNAQSIDSTSNTKEFKRDQ
eukprot:TRINITY_DN1060_c0_g1_i4.p1 TRINITY_DN1060_c0_g1~~TRINITY_DN1060_c0_g1_i4.p1  ORF type:complete len:255 (+),score=48.65 TRINITY_DN1060_c0_g1_i4:33-767(+)